MTDQELARHGADFNGCGASRGNEIHVDKHLDPDLSAVSGALGLQDATLNS
ncbi:hypothetical protein [Streptomyces sp. SP17KL33]|uniref:hypothetical protein n=1 Tax=Streptomyces sp. SP17KL33 TaxID=3002534 RepID=UPI002E76A198|nr:hypothetical protein [Streptomyces sp. SP17KL33]MEE1837434.1 hypothetical protein [Streptomyces sp. SP17KL33]